MIVLKCIRPDKIVNAIQNFIVEKIGHKFIEPPAFDLKKSYRDSNHKMPLIFILSSGTDPVADFAKFAIDMGMNERKNSISLGQGMAKRAENDKRLSGKRKVVFISKLPFINFMDAFSWTNCRTTLRWNSSWFQNVVNFYAYSQISSFNSPKLCKNDSGTSTGIESKFKEILRDIGWSRT